MPTPSFKLHLYVPGLLGGPPLADARQWMRDTRLPALERLLARAEGQSSQALDSDAQLARLFGLAQSAGRDLPLAAVSAAMDGLPADDGCWLRADPVHLRADIAQLYLFDAQSFELNLVEAKTLASSISEHFSDADWQLHVAHPGRWYLRMEQAPALVTHALARVRGQDINPLLPAGADASGWRVMLNELQMLLHTHPVNEARQQRGLPAINSLWLWGLGELPEPVRPGWSQLWSDSDTAVALGRWAGLPRAAQPDEANLLLEQLLSPGRHLLVMEQGQRLVDYADPEGWRGFLQDFEQHWAGPLLQALRTGRLAELVLDTGQGRQFRLAGGRWHGWWRRPRPFAEWMQGTP